MFVHKVLMFYFFSISLNVFIMLKLDGPTDWSWFLVLSPMWLLDVLLLTLSLAQVFLSNIPALVRYSGTQDEVLTRTRSFWFLAFVICKLLFQILVCMRASSMIFTPLTVVMIPLWIILSGVCVDLFAACFNIVQPPVIEYLEDRRKKQKTTSEQSNQATTSHSSKPTFSGGKKSDESSL